MRILSTQVLSPQKVIEATMPVLRAGGLIVYPTDTVYGFLVDATNEKAVKKLIAFKERPAGRAISIFVYDLTMMKRYIKLEKEQDQRLQFLLPGPYTIVLRSLGNTSKLLEAENHTLGVRIPSYKLVIDLIHEYRHPLTATSANLSGKPSVYSIPTLLKQLSKKKEGLIDLIVDAGQLPRNKPSTVVDFTDEEIKILRQGDKDVGTQKKYTSESEEETKMIAKEVIEEVLKKTTLTPVVFIIEGELGVGKTQFVKGIGEYLGIEKIISPTFVVYYEYLAKKHGVNNLIHFDLYKIQEKSEFKHLGIENYLKSGNVLCFEWGEKAGEIYNFLKEKAKIIIIKMKHISDSKREIIVSA